MTNRCRVVYSNSRGGMFSMVKSVMSALNRCDEAGLEPNVEVRDTPFREVGFDGNVWDQLFAKIGSLEGEFNSTDENWMHDCFPINDCWFHKRALGKKIIDKWIKPADAVQERINKWNGELQKKKCRIGVHYRGLDKHTECTQNPPELYLKVASKLMKDTGESSLLLCTDTSAAIEVFSSIENLIYTDSERGSELTTEKGIHFTAMNKQRAASDAILDAYLLASCDYMICATSNLSEYATYLNPDTILISLR